MITDRLSNASLYRSLNPRIARAFDYVTLTDFGSIADGKYAIDGDTIFALVQRYSTQPASARFWEAHRRYIDLQYVIEGRERIGYAHLSGFAQQPYEDARDFLPITGTGDFVTVPAGSFMLLWPEDAHMPGIAVDAPAPVTKVVVKIAVA